MVLISLDIIQGVVAIDNTEIFPLVEVEGFRGEQRTNLVFSPERCTKGAWLVDLVAFFRGQIPRSIGALITGYRAVTIKRHY
ncbi:hypothetical protein [Roseibium sp.]|uniref:hypothetical protein n=1 Tax=Roseibium sp. TaxID=1936156 RepID=UPI001B2CF70F|nr:hypothetical protein [Roseibium sp.]MBO6858486.1 hypothetical protein [Roseibium sp.]